LPCSRFTDTGLAKHAEWQKTWDLQRREDAGETVDVPVPPKYKSSDFRSATTWRHRGKLDVPKERFIAYPGAESNSDPSPLVGWAGWDHLEQATALAGLYQQRKDEDGWGTDKLTPLLAGLWELVPWLKQWHNAPSAEYGGLRLGDFYETFVNDEVRSFGITLDDLKAWRPPRGRGRKRARSGSARKKGRSTGRKPSVTPETLLEALGRLVADAPTGNGEPAVAQTDLARHLGVGSATVGKVARQLVADGAIVEVSKRPKRYATIRPERDQG
jgi:hypothetical protein